MRRNWLKKAVSLAAFMMLCIVQASAGSPYDYYEYTTDNYNGLVWSADYVANSVAAPAAYTVEKVLNADNLGLTVPLRSPEDICIAPDGSVYILDSGDIESGNGRIIVLEKDLKSVRYIIESVEIAGIQNNFRTARGMYIGKDNRIFVCITAGAKILEIEAPPKTAETLHNPNLTVEAKLICIYEKPDVSSVKDNFEYKPINMVVDQSGRMFVVCEGVFDGLVCLKSDGTFSGFIGANRVTPSLIDLIWRQFATSTQIEKQVDFIPVEFSSVSIDEEGFIFTTARGDSKNQMVRKLNLAGADVLKRGVMPLNGDLSPLNQRGTPGTASDFIDVAIGANGLFSCLDSARGRIFTYDSDGNIAFIFGGLQSQSGAFRKPSALAWHDQKLLVLDKDYGEITVFSPTSYGENILSAISYQYNGEFKQAWNAWNEVLKRNTNNQIAHLNVGKALYDNKQFKQAMIHFKIGNSQQLYSKAYAVIRKQTLAKIMPGIFIFGFIIILLVFLRWFISYLKSVQDRYQFFKRRAKDYVDKRK